MMPQDFAQAPSPPPVRGRDADAAGSASEDAIAVLVEQVRDLQRDHEAVTARQQDLTGRLTALEEDVRALAHAYARGPRHAQPRAHGRAPRRGHRG